MPSFDPSKSRELTSTTETKVDLEPSSPSMPTFDRQEFLISERPRPEPNMFDLGEFILDIRLDLSAGHIIRIIGNDERTGNKIADIVNEGKNFTRDEREVLFDRVDALLILERDSDRIPQRKINEFREAMDWIESDLDIRGSAPPPEN